VEWSDVVAIAILYLLYINMRDAQPPLSMDLTFLQTAMTFARGCIAPAPQKEVNRPECCGGKAWLEGEGLTPNDSPQISGTIKFRCNGVLADSPCAPDEFRCNGVPAGSRCAPDEEHPPWLGKLCEGSATCTEDPWGGGYYCVH